jgi:hypothetical protein
MATAYIDDLAMFLSIYAELPLTSVGQDGNTGPIARILAGSITVVIGNG